MASIDARTESALTEPERQALVAARNELVMENQGLVHQVAKGFRGRGVEMDDLVGWGQLGLLRAAELFEPERGLRFSTYATYWIRNAIFAGLGRAGWVRLSKAARSEAAKVHRRAAAIREETGVEPRVEDVVDALRADGTFGQGQSRDRIVRSAVAASVEFHPVDDAFEYDGPASPSPLSTLIVAEHREQLSLALSRLPWGQRRFLDVRYGLGGHPPLPLRATAAALGLTLATAARRETAALSSLRKILNRRQSEPEG